MELLISFLMILGVFGTEEEALQLSSTELEEVRIEYHYDMVNQFDEEYASIFGWDLEEVE